MQCEDVGLDTVYRMLTQCWTAELVGRHHFEAGSAVFELARGDHHDHMICLDSGKVIEFVDPIIEKRQREIADEHGFEIEDHSLIIYVRPKKK